MNMSVEDFDDLTVIRGIGLARQKVLRELLDIYTYQDLAELPVSEIESRLKAEGQIVSRKSIESWVTQAKELAERTGRTAQPDFESPEVNESGKSYSQAREDGWRPFASFVIEFQTREIDSERYERRTTVHYMEEDTGTMWSGIVGPQLCEWILEQIDEPVDLTLEDQGLSPKKQEEVEIPVDEAVKVNVQQIRLFQPPNADIPIGILEDRKPFIGSVKANIPFTLEISFDITGVAVDKIIEKQVRCLVQSYAYELTVGNRIHLGDRELENLEKGKYTYTLTLPETSLKIGKYRFWVLVGLDNGRTIQNYIEVPTLQIN
jgi:hypothetical protein